MQRKGKLHLLDPTAHKILSGRGVPEDPEIVLRKKNLGKEKLYPFNPNIEAIGRNPERR